MTVQQTAPFSGLLPVAVSRYSLPAVAKSAAGIAARVTQWRHQTRLASFLRRSSTHPFFGLWCLHRGSCQIMVVRAGQPSGWPVSIEAGTANPVRATTHEICSSGGGDNRYSMEVALMATTLTPSHPQFVFVFAAVRRADRKPRICMLRTVAGDEHAARLSLVRDYVLSFAGRLPVAEVRA
ncbi:host cell division inhibitor Icd-like protein [Enterobacter hormaechei]